MLLTDRARGGCLVVLRSLAIVLTTSLTLSACRSHERVPAGRLPTTAEASAVLGVNWCQVVHRPVDRTPGQSLSVMMPIDGEQYRIDLEPHSVRAAGYQVLVQGANGAVTAPKGGPVRTLRGTVRGRPGCRVAGAVVVGAGTGASVVPHSD